jgi:ribosomal protein S18 acetylase RimI-like enzyme
MPNFTITKVTAENIDALGLFCVKNRKHAGHVAKSSWLREHLEEGIRLRMLVTGDGKQAGFIEYAPAEGSWRVLDAPGYLVIHCLWVSSKGFTSRGMATALLEESVRDAKANGSRGVAVVTSDGPWMADRRVFVKSGFEIVDETEPYYQLLANQLRDGPRPSFPSDLTERIGAPGGLRLLYANQCPYVGKAVAELPDVARRFGTRLGLVEMKDASEARATMPSPYGVFALVYNGRLLADHPISATRFRNILSRDLGLREKDTD